MRLRRALPTICFVLLLAGILRAESTSTSASPVPSSDSSTTAAVIDRLESAASALVEEPLADTTPVEETEPPEPEEPVEKQAAAEVDKPVEESETVPPPAWDTAGSFLEKPARPPKRSRLTGLKRRVGSWVRRNRLARWVRNQVWHIIAFVAFVTAVALAVNLFVRQKESKRFLTTTRLSIVDKEVRRACNYIEKNYADTGLSVESLCDDLTTGPAFLHALFNRELGMSVEEFIVQVRMNRARIELGDNPELGMDELATRVGCADARALARDFLRVTGISIDEYRANA